MANQPMRQKTAQCAFVFNYLYDCMIQYADGTWGGGCEIATTYDDGEAFVNAFGKRFPGRLFDDNGKKTANRLRRLALEMYRDGWLERYRLSNHDQYHPGQEPNWQYVYSVAPEYASKLKKKHWTTEYMARRYQGDGDPWLALSSPSGER